MVAKLNTDRKEVKRELTGNRIFYICPKCKKLLYIKTKYKKNLCMNCGQYLNWDSLETQWWTEYIICHDRDEARYCTEIYKKCTGYDFWDHDIFLDQSLAINQKWPKEMMFPFLERKGYGRFMRQTAKDGFERLIF